MITHESMLEHGWTYDIRTKTYHRGKEWATVEMVEKQNGELMERIMRMVEGGKKL